MRFLRDRIADELQDFVAGHDHGAAGEKGVRCRDAAPQNASVPDRRALLGVEGFVEGGMETIGSNQSRAVVMAPRFAGCLVDEFGADAVFRLSPAGEVMAGEN